MAPLVCVLGLLIFAPILSPQYILWLLPAAAIVAARRNWVMAGLTVAVTALTTIVFATILTQIKGQFWSMVPLVTRNAPARRHAGRRPGAAGATVRPRDRPAPTRRSGAAAPATVGGPAARYSQPFFLNHV